MYKLFGTLLFALVLLTACNAGSARKKSSAAPPASLPSVTAAPASQPANSPAPVTTTTATPATGVNPPHGQPGHRCDLAVGAPLNGQASPSVVIPGNQQQNNKVITQPSPATTTMPMPANTSGKGVRLNPPHGQPGHDCSVQVGQPLKS